MTAESKRFKQYFSSVLPKNLNRKTISQAKLTEASNITIKKIERLEKKMCHMSYR